MERFTMMAAVLTSPEWVKGLLDWMGRSGWSRLGRLLLVAAACGGLLLAVKLVTRAVRRAVDDGKDDVTSDSERRAETLGSVLTNASSS